VEGYKLLPDVKSLYDEGLLAVPLYYRSKIPTVKWGNWREDRPTLEILQSVFDTELYRGLGILMGAISNNLVVLDFDKPNVYAHWHRKFPIETRTVRTNRGFHVYLKLAQLPMGTLSMSGGEIKGNGYVVAPPSIHPSGRMYTYRNPGSQIYTARSLSAIGIEVSLPQLGTATIPDPETEAPKSAKGRNTLVRDIKRALPLARFLQQYTALTPSGGHYLKCVCPLHNDHSPSMWVNTRLDLCGCFAPGCQGNERAMDVINLYAKMSNISNRDAIFSLASQLHLI
jgi:hypothetical protein